MSSEGTEGSSAELKYGLGGWRRRERGPHCAATEKQRSGGGDGGGGE